MYFDEKQQKPILFLGLMWQGMEPTIYHILGEHAYHIIPLRQFKTNLPFPP
jgi:hypothetical protein